MVRRSIGSCTLPSTSRVTTCGLPTVSSKPSRRIISTRIGELQLAAALDLPGVGALGRQHPDRHVADELGVEPVLDQAGGELRAALAGQRRGVDADGHRDRRLVDGDDRQRTRVVGVGERLADGDLGDAGDGDDVAGAGRLGRHPVERLGHEQLGDLDPLDRCRRRGTRRRSGPCGSCPCGRGTGRGGRGTGDASRLVTCACSGRLRVVRRRGDRLERSCANSGSRSRLSGMPPSSGLGQRGAAGLGRGVDDREVDLLLVGVEVEEQLVGLVDDLGDAGVGPVDLVDDEDDRQPLLQRLAQHEAGLRQRALAGVDEQQHAVDHREAALDLAAEVGVAGGVDDVEASPRAPSAMRAAPRCSSRGS